MFKEDSKIVFFGDSLIKRTGIVSSPNPARKYMIDYTGSFVDILTKKLIVHFPEISFEFYNKGVGGNTTEDLLKRVKQEVLLLKPNIIILLIGQNDAIKHTIDKFEDNLTDLLETMNRNNIKVIQLSTTPNLKNMEINIILDEFDAIIKNKSEFYGNIYVDLKMPFKKAMAHKMYDCPIELLIDGVHMTELGNILIADLVYDAMVNLLITH